MAACAVFLTVTPARVLFAITFPAPAAVPPIVAVGVLSSHAECSAGTKGGDAIGGGAEKVPLHGDVAAKDARYASPAQEMTLPGTGRGAADRGPTSRASIPTPPALSRPHRPGNVGADVVSLHG